MIRATVGNPDVKFSNNQVSLSLQSSWTPKSNQVAVDSVQIYYSWRNLTAAKNNSSYQYLWNGVSFPVNMQDGNYTFTDFNAYLQQVMVANGHYLIDANGNNVYYLNWTVNPTYYCLSLTATNVPASLPTGSINGGNVVFNSLCPQVVIPATNITTYTGFAAGNYPATQSASISITNGGVPAVTDITAVNVLCNFTKDDGFTSNAQILCTFSPNESGAIPGGQITFRPFLSAWQPVADGKFDRLIFTFTDQQFRPLQILDSTGLSIICRIR
jgi:hypothetical protein